MATKVFLYAILLIGGLIAGLAPMHADTPKPIAHVGPWPVASQLIGYPDRLWFATPVKGINHNSADLWSMDTGTGNVRYERYLFSQDAGIPTVHRGLLYWPFGDMRDESGWGSDGLCGSPKSALKTTIYTPSPVRDRHNSDALCGRRNARLWAVQAKRNGGVVWSSRDGDSWQKEQDFTGGRAWAIARVGGKTLVGGAGADGKAIIWGQPGSGNINPQVDRKTALPWCSPVKGAVSIADWTGARENMIGSISAEDNYAGHATPPAKRVYLQALLLPPDCYFRQLLDHPKPDRQVDAIGGQFTISTAELANWKMLWAKDLPEKGRLRQRFCSATGPGNLTDRKNGSIDY